jgi:hypothetical protein
MNITDDSRVLRRYLLGDLPTDEGDALEVELLAEGDAFQAMLAAEDDLVDDYARGALTGADREAFEARFLARSGSAGRIAFARGLQAIGGERTAPAAEARPTSERRTATSVPWSERFSVWLGGLVPAPALRLAAAAAAVALVAVAGFSVWQTAALHRQVARLEASQQQSQQQLAGERSDLARREQELNRELAAARRAAGELRTSDEASSDELAAASRRIEELEGEVTSLRRLPKPRRQEITASFLLALATRGSGVPELVLPDAADRVSLQLQTGDGAYYDSFQVRLLGAGGAEVWSRTGLAATAATGTVDVELPAELLAPGRYEALLEGVGDDGGNELVGAYEFQLVAAGPLPTEPDLSSPRRP